MNSRKNAGRKADYMCSGLVYCSCGAKMHVYKGTRSGHTYYRYVCAKHCGRPTVLMSTVDEAAIKYLHELLSEPNQTLITAAMRRYQSDSKNRLTAFYDVLNARIAEKQKEYDTLMRNLSSGVLPSDIVSDIGQRMTEIKAEIKALEATEPPEDYTVDTIRQWLNALKNNPDEKAVKLLIKRIDVSGDKNNNVFNIQSTLNTLLEIVVAGEGFEPTTSGL